MMMHRRGAVPGGSAKKAAECLLDHSSASAAAAAGVTCHGAESPPLHEASTVPDSSPLAVAATPTSATTSATTSTATAQAAAASSNLLSAAGSHLFRKRRKKSTTAHAYQYRDRNCTCNCKRNRNRNRNSLAIIIGTGLAWAAIAVFISAALYGVALVVGRGIRLWWHRHDVNTKRPHAELKGLYGYTVLPWNDLYQVPEAMEIVGDRSDEYAHLRQQFDQELLPPHPARSLQRVAELTTDIYEPMPMDAHHSDQVPYDIYDCPESPPAGYPFAWNLMDITHNWNPDDTVNIPTNIYQSLCVFDFQRDYDKAMRYRSAELPFLVINDPEVARAVERWNSPGYVDQMLGNVQHRAEYSENNHFMYYVPVPQNRRRRRPVADNNKDLPRRGIVAPEGWKEPTKMIRMTFKEWLRVANVTDDRLGPENPHWYFRLIGCGLMGNEGSCDHGSSEYLFDELPFFQPKPTLYIVEPEEQKGIHCRFGMKGVIAENHFDGSRNAIVVLGGSRRYILAHPNQCSNLALYPKGHPSARHSATDWSNPDLEQFPEFAQAQANEVVMQPGQVLYLPTNWFHFIVSLELNFQCNTRSGIGQDYMGPLAACGF